MSTATSPNTGSDGNNREPLDEGLARVFRTHTLPPSVERDQPVELAA